MQAGWKVIAATVQGTSHRKDGIACQDAHYYKLLRNCVIAAVADGAGSAEYSEIGATCAVEQVVTILESLITETNPQDEDDWFEIVTQAFLHTREALINIAVDREIDLRSLATTLTCIVVMDGLLIVGQVGDGAVVAQANSHEVFVVAQPQRGEYANETHFLTLDEVAQKIDFSTRSQELSAIGLMTDGIVRLAIDSATSKPHHPFFLPLIAFADNATDPGEATRQLSDFLESERVCERTDDDKTLLIVVPILG